MLWKVSLRAFPVQNEEGVFPPLPSNKPAVDDASQLGTPNQPGRSTVIVTPATNSTYGRNSYATDTIHQVPSCHHLLTHTHYLPPCSFA